MMSKRKIIRPFFIGSAFLLTCVLLSCNRNVRWYEDFPPTWEIDVPRLSIRDERFREVLDSLSERENRCRPFDSALVWRVQTVCLRPDSCRVVITRMREASGAYGYLAAGDRLFFFDGDFIPSLFAVENEVRRFSGENDGGIPYAETYSTWVYTYVPGRMLLRGAWPFPCRK